MKAALVLVAVLAGVAHAGSPTMDRAIERYDKRDFYSASVELQKVLDGDTGDDEATKQRARFFQAKTMFGMGFPIMAASLIHSITVDAKHRYRIAALGWMVAVLDRLDTELTRNGLGAVTPADTDDPTLDAVADALRFYAGEAAVEAKDPARAEALLARVSRGSKRWYAATIALARLHGPAALKPDELSTLVEAARSADARTAREALYLIALAQRTNPAATVSLAQVARPLSLFELQRATIAQRAPGLETADPIAVGAALAALGCRQAPLEGPRVAEVATDAAARAGALRGANPDNAETFERMKQLFATGPQTPADAAVFAAMVTPAIEDGLAAQAELDTELRLMMGTDKAWQTTQVAAQVLQELTVLSAVTAADAGAREAERLQVLVRDFATVAMYVKSATGMAGLAIPAEWCARQRGPRAVAAVPPVVAQGSGDTRGVASSHADELGRPGGAPARGCGCASGGTDADAGAALVGFAIVVAGRRRRRV